MSDEDRRWTLRVISHARAVVFPQYASEADAAEAMIFFEDKMGYEVWWEGQRPVGWR